MGACLPQVNDLMKLSGVPPIISKLLIILTLFEASAFSSEPRHLQSFSEGTDGWVVLDSTDGHPKKPLKIEVWAKAGGVNDSPHLQGTRSSGNGVYFSVDAKVRGEFGGDLRRYASERSHDLEIAFSMKATDATEGASGKRRPILWLYENEGTGWECALREDHPCLDETWNEYKVIINVNWTNEEAEANGWKASPGATSFQDTIQNIGRLRLGTTAPGGYGHIVSLDELSISPSQ